MASNKRMIDIEREINDFFASEEFKELALSNGAYRDSCNSGQFSIYNSTQMDPVLKAVNEKIKDFVDNICIKDRRVYIEITLPNGDKGGTYIGNVIITDYGFGLNNRWHIRFDNEYIYYLQKNLDYKPVPYRRIDINEKIFNMKKKERLAEYKNTISSLHREAFYIKKEIARSVKKKKAVEKWEYKEDSANVER
jgi:hypothetical protein